MICIWIQVRHIPPTAQSSNDPNGDLEESITASILEKSQITLNLPEGATKPEEFSSQESYSSGTSNGSSVEMKRKPVKGAGAVRGRTQQITARAGAKRPVNQSVQDLFNSVSSDVEQTNQTQQSQQMLLTQSSQECEARESAKMLVIMQCGEQRLITFTLPRESCTVQELLEQVGVPFTPDTNIQCVSNPGANIDYVVTVGDPVQEVQASSELIMRSEGNIEQQQQQPQQQQPQVQPERSPVRPAGNQFTTSTPIAQRPPSFGQQMAPQMTPIRPPAPPAPEPPEPPKPPAIEKKLIDGWLALCTNCGFCGLDHAKCERCNQVLINPKRIPCSQPKPTVAPPPPPIRTQVPSLALPQQSKIAKQVIRMPKEPMTSKKLEIVAKKLPELTRSFTSTTNSVTAPLTSSLASATSSVTLARSVEKTTKPRGGASVRGRGRGAKPAEAQEPIILTLSSDDEDDDKKPKVKAPAKKPVSLFSYLIPKYLFKLLFLQRLQHIF